jgi:multiple sugar transport system ATP-binding protein
VAPVELIHVTKQFHDGTVAIDDLSLTVDEGEFVILVGPSGCGKTTALRIVAGLEEATSGDVRIGDRLVNEVQPAKRDIAMVFQNYALYPHMSVFDNIAFPLRQQNVKKQETTRRVNDVAQLLNIQELLMRRPRELSGGQRQRVAIGRALVRQPQAFLMDEPLSNLDAKLRGQMRAELISLHARLDITTIYVTHDQTEAMTLADRVVVLDRGVVQQIDTPDRLYQHPSNTFVAGFIGSPSMNFLQGTISDNQLRLGPHALDLSAEAVHVADNVIVGLRPEDFAIDTDATGSIAAEVQIVERLGPEVIVHLRADGIRLATPAYRSDKAEDTQVTDLADSFIARFDANFSAQPGERIGVSVNRDRLRLFDPQSGAALSLAPPAERKTSASPKASRRP